MRYLINTVQTHLKKFAGLAVTAVLALSLLANFNAAAAPAHSKPYLSIVRDSAYYELYNYAKQFEKTSELIEGFVNDKDAVPAGD